MPQPSIIFVDEVDSVLGKRGGGGGKGGGGGGEGSAPDRRVTNEFLACIEGIQGGSEDRVIVIAATNHPWDLDEAALSRCVQGHCEGRALREPSVGRAALGSSCTQLDRLFQCVGSNSHAMSHGDGAI